MASDETLRCIRQSLFKLEGMFLALDHYPEKTDRQVTGIRLIEGVRNLLKDLEPSDAQADQV